MKSTPYCFCLLLGASKDKNWYYVLNNNGEAGYGKIICAERDKYFNVELFFSSYVPKNYVMVEQRSAETQVFLDSLRDRLRMKDMAHKDKAELLSNLEGVS